jgi:sugar lactone lactonase YvrE
VFNVDLEFLFEFGSGDLDLYEPSKIDVDLAGNIYIRDRSSGVKLFDSTGNYISTMNTGTIRDLAVRGGKVFVTTINDSIKVFSFDDSLLAAWGGSGTTDGKINSGQWLYVDDSSKVYLCDQNNKRIQVFDTIGNVLSVIDMPDYPGSIAVDNLGRIFVIENGKKLKVYRTDGTLIAQHKFKRYGTFTDPRGMALSPDGTIYIILQASGNLLVMSFLLL